MKEQLALLRELQRIDLDLDRLNEEKGGLQERLDEHRSVLSKLTTELDAQKAELEEVRTLERSKKRDMAETKETLGERKKRLLNVASTKEYNAVEKEIEVLQKSAENLEEELLKLSEAIETTEVSIETKSAMTAELAKSISSEEAAASDDLGRLDDQIDRLNKRTDEARGEVSKRVLYKYDFIRSRRPGLAIVASRDGHCEGCFMSLPPQLFIQVQRGETLETCPSCQRIMFFWEHASGEEGQELRETA